MEHVPEKNVKEISIPLDLLKVFEKAPGIIIDDYSPIGIMRPDIRVLRKILESKELMQKVTESFDVVLVPKAWRT